MNAAYGSRCDWGRDADGDDGAAGAMKCGKYDKSANGWVAWPPAHLFHDVPRLDSVVPKHPSPGQQDRWAGLNPAIGAQCNQVGLDCGHHGVEAKEPLRWA